MGGQLLATALPSRAGGIRGWRLPMWEKLVSPPPALQPAQPCRYLTLHQHVEELVPRLLGIPFHTQVPQVVVCYPEAWQVAHVGTLVIQPSALGAGDEVEELLRLWRRH